jgi:translocation and assembly module TamB
VRIDILNEWQQLQWEMPQGMLRSSRGALHLRGRADDLLVDLDLLAALSDRPEAAVTASGNARWLPQPGFNVSYRLQDLDPAYIHPHFSGRLASQGRLAGVLRDGALDLDVQARSLDGEVNGHAVAGAVTANVSPQGIEIAESFVTLGDNTVRLQGGINGVMAFDIAAELGDFSQVMPAVTGSARGRVSLRGTPELPEINGEVLLTSLGANGVLLDDAEVRIAGSAGEHTLRLRVAAYETNVVAEARGALDASGWSGRMTRLELDNPLAGQWVSSNASDLQVTAALSRLAELCLERTGTTGKACLGGAFAPDGRSAFDLYVTGLPIAALPIELPAGVSVSGLASARLTAARVNEKLRADARLEFTDTAFDAVYMDERVTLALAEARGQASIVNDRLDSSFRLVLADGSGSASASLAIPDISADERLIDGSGDVNISDASLFAFFVPGISQPQGRIDGEIGIAGSATAPEFTGSLHISDGAFGVRQTGITISDLKLDLTQFEPGQVRLTGHARSGQGTIDVAGYTWIGQDLGIRSEVTLNGENFELARLPDWQVAASPAITIVFDDRTTLITGELGIPAARVAMREAPQSVVKSSSDTIVHREQADEPERRRRIDIDVRTSLGDDVQFAGFGLTAGLNGSVVVRGGTQTPYTGQGKLSLVDGRYKAFGQELVIERGDLVFNGPIEEPLLDVVAVRNVQDYRVGIRLAGTPSRLSSEIFSDPVLGDAEALAYLLTGRRLADASSTGEGQALDNAAFTLGLSGAGLIAAQVRGQLGLETLAVEGIGDESRLVAGKRLGDRLLVEYGYGLVDKLGTLLLRYQLNERLVLESRTGTASYFDIVYRRRKQ